MRIEVEILMQVLIPVFFFTLDIPVIDSIIMARPTKSNVLFQQMLGRGMRLHPGKEDCLVLDFVDVVRGDGLVTVPTLLGLDTDAILQGKHFRGSVFNFFIES